MSCRTVNLSTLELHKSLRMKPEFYDFILSDWPRLTKDWKFDFRLKDCIKSIRNGKDVKKEHYSFIETDYFYMTVNNIKPYEFCYDNKIYLDFEAGKALERFMLAKDDLIITRSGSVGIARLFDIEAEELVVIPSGYLIVVSIDNEVINPKWLEHYSASSSTRKYFEILSSGKTQHNLSQYDILNLPVPNLNSQRSVKFFENVNSIESRIKDLQQDNISLQSSIDEVLTNFKVKSKSLSSYRAEALTTSLMNVCENKALRIGSEYNDFWLTHNGRLFEGTDDQFKILQLKRMLQATPKSILKKGPLVEPRILIDFDQLESARGIIIDLENYVVELGSDRLEFGDCDFLTNKLRPYLGYTILNRPHLPLVGTTEFIPFEVRDKSEVLVEYIRYLFLSNEYLEKSKFLMSGKEHPRINAADILNIRIPLPRKEVQQRIVDEVSARESKSQKARQQIYHLRSCVDDLINEELKHH